MADSAVSSWTALAGADLAAGDLFPVIDVSAVGAAKNKSMVPAEIRIGLYGAFSGSFASLTSKPTTIAGYGLTDAASLGANTFTAKQTITQGTANAGIIASTGYSLTGSDATNMIDLAGTWNTSGNPTLIKANVTNTASGATSLLLDLQASAVSQFKVLKDGTTTIRGTNGNAIIILGDTSGNYAAIGQYNGNILVGDLNGNSKFMLSRHTGQITTASDAFFGFASTATNFTEPDAFFARGGGAAIIQMGADAAGVTNQHFKACNRITSDGVGANLTLSGGNGRGGAGGSLILATYSTAGAATAGTLTNHLTLDTSGVLTFANDVHMAFDTSSGTKFGTATTQKLAFYNATPIAQQGSIADPSGGAIIDTEARAAIVDVISRLETIGLIATV